jgi:hypothetical protein
MSNESSLGDQPLLFAALEWFREDNVIAGWLRAKGWRPERDREA